jgi:nitroimidazol reductase NimA-like FMN-containing flavoprotein (pyridoxamine 5'-phosphate oxidase superfamily)
VTEPTDLRALAGSIVEANSFLTLATADADGRPWASPLWYAPSEDRSTFWWVSSPDAVHSRNLAIRPEVAIVIFDSHQAGGWTSLYLSATAQELDDVDDGIARFSARSVDQGFRSWTREDVVPPAKHRLYRATVVEAFVLDPHDERIPVGLG